MSIGFQHLYGPETTQGKQLLAQQAILAAIGNLQLPDLRAWFKVLFPALPQIPYYKTFSFSDPVDATASIPIGKKLFADVYMSANLFKEASTNNTDVGVKLHAMYGMQSIFMVSAAVHGDDILPYPSHSEHFTGVIDRLWFQKFGSGECIAEGRVVVKGFVLPDDFDVTTLTALEEIPIQLPPSTVIEYLPKPQAMTLNLDDFPGDHTEYVNADMNGLSYHVYYKEGNNFLTPGEHYVSLPGGGIKLTGFGPIQPFQTFLIIF